MRMSVDTPKGKAAIWKHLDKLEEWTGRNLVKFSNDKCQAPGME